MKWALLIAAIMVISVTDKITLSYLGLPRDTWAVYLAMGVAYCVGVAVVSLQSPSA